MGELVVPCGSGSTPIVGAVAQVVASSRASHEAQLGSRNHWRVDPNLGVMETTKLEVSDGQCEKYGRRSSSMMVMNGQQ